MRGRWVLTRLVELSDDTHPVTRAVVAAYEEGAERALLERDVEDVAYHAERCDDALREVTGDVAEGYDLSADEAERERWLRRQLETMLPWLARAKAVLG